MKALLAILLLFWATSANAAPWMFSTSLPYSPPASRRVLALPLPDSGVYTKSGRRFLQSRIIVGGQTVDNYYVYETWNQSGGR